MTISADELYDFYAHLGQALHSVQLVEGTLHKILAIRLHFENERPSPKQAEEILERYRAKTLGGLLSEATRGQALPNPILRSLEKLNQDRREVVHRLQEQTAENLRANPTFRFHIISYLMDVANHAFDLNTRLTHDLISRRPDLLESPVFAAELNKRLRKQGFI